MSTPSPKSFSGAACELFINNCTHGKLVSPGEFPKKNVLRGTFFQNRIFGDSKNFFSFRWYILSRMLHDSGHMNTWTIHLSSTGRCLACCGSTFNLHQYVSIVRACRRESGLAREQEGKRKLCRNPHSGSFDFMHCLKWENSDVHFPYWRSLPILATLNVFSITRCNGR